VRVFSTSPRPVKVWDGNGAVPMDDATLAQALDIAGLPFIHKHVALMPDAHWGLGATVGSVIATKNAVIPAAVGVDIGCGMLAIPTGWRAPEIVGWLDRLRAAIEVAVPHGRSDHGRIDTDEGGWKLRPLEEVKEVYDREFRAGLNELMERDRGVFAQGRTRPHTHAWNMLGTLGGGNHFIEVCLERGTDTVWLMLHSGSRGIGNRIARYFIARAQEKCAAWHSKLPNKDLSFFPRGEKAYDDYLFALDWCQRYAWENRLLMMRQALRAINATLGEDRAPRAADLIHCHHNYAAIENHFGENVIVTRKGAVRAREGDLGIIPGSMGAKSFIVRGLGNPESFHSCSHGAGRVMSRTAARRTITKEQHAADTHGVHCRKDETVLDESPRAYKDIDAVMAAQVDLVEPATVLKQVVCVKG